MAENTQSVLERTAADQWKVLPSGLTVLVRPMPGYSGTHVIYATRFGSIDRGFPAGGAGSASAAGVAHFLRAQACSRMRTAMPFAKFAKDRRECQCFHGLRPHLLPLYGHGTAGREP